MKKTELADVLMRWYDAYVSYHFEDCPSCDFDLPKIECTCSKRLMSLVDAEEDLAQVVDRIRNGNALEQLSLLTEFSMN